MRSLRFLLTRRWILLAITVALLAVLAWRLGVWQFHRLEDRKVTNAIVERNVAAAAVPVDDVLEVGGRVAATDEWRRVTATGEYDDADTVVVRYQTRDGEAGVDVVVPLRTEQGPVLLVDRGWLAAPNRAADVSDVPPPPSGRVTVTGWVRADGTGGSTRVSDHSVRAISSSAIGDAMGLQAYGGFVDLDSETPRAEQVLGKPELPDPSNGPHFFYGLQWWFFGLLALFGFGYLAYDEWRGPRRPHQSSGSPDGSPNRSPAGSQGAQHAPVDREHDTADEA